MTGVWRLVCGDRFGRGRCSGTLVAPVALFAGIVAVPRVDGGVQAALGILPDNGCAIYLRGFAGVAQYPLTQVIRPVAGGHGAFKVISRHAADIRVAGYIHLCKRQVLYRAAEEFANQSYTVLIREVDGQPRDGVASSIGGAVVRRTGGAYRCPVALAFVYRREGNVSSQGAVLRFTALCGLSPCS